MIKSESDIEAEQSRETLQGLVEQLLSSNHEISRRLQTLEENIETGSVLTYCYRNGHVPDVPEGEPQSERDSSHRNSEETSSYELDPFVQYMRGAQSGFQVDLGTSRVYMRTERYKSDVSFTSSAVRSHAWSVFTGLSLSEVSVISAIAIPVYLDEIYNNALYSGTFGHGSAEKNRNSLPISILTEPVAERSSDIEIRMIPARSSSSFKHEIATQESVSSLPSVHALNVPRDTSQTCE